MQEIAAIPTLYKGIQFRSRLEAKWACFFDLLEWPWLYEPIDLQGYIPDFILSFKKPLLVEVKPALTYEALTENKGKIDSSGWEHDALLVGTKPIWKPERPEWKGSSSIGLLGEFFEFPEQEAHALMKGRWLIPASPAKKGFTWAEGVWVTDYKNGVGVMHALGSYEDRTDKVPYNSTIEYATNELDKVQVLWAKACNTVQWQGRGSR
jgi:hypothetical protein